MRQGSTRSIPSSSESTEQKPDYHYTAHRNVPSISNMPNGSASRPTSYTPSYMSNIARKPTPTSIHSREQSMSRSSNHIDVPRTPARSIHALDTPTTPAGVATAPAGALLVLAIGALPASTLSDLEILLGKQNFSSITVVAGPEHAAALKQLKMDIYALIGKLRREIAVATTIKDTWQQIDIEEIIQDVTRSGSGIQGVLCSPQFETGLTDPSILSMEDGELEGCLETSLTFLHSVSKATIVHLLSRCKPSAGALNDSFRTTPRGPSFLVTGQQATSPAARIAKAACDSLILQLAQATSTQRLAVGYTDALLIPEPKRVDTAQASDGPIMQPEIPWSPTYEDSVFTPGESPTKLYAMWAMQEELAS